MSIKLRTVMDALWGTCAGVIEFRAIAPPAQKFAALTEKQYFGAFLRVHTEQDCFWGVATRLDDSGGTAENCQHLPALFADLDFATIPEAEARKTLAQIPLPPSLVIHSGHGLHPYWFVHKPFDLQILRERTAAHKLLARLAMYCASDTAVVDVARVLRVPTTFNHKYDPPRFVQIEAFDVARRYDPLEFDSWLPPPAERALATPFKVPAVVEPGNRNTTLFKLGRALKAKGIPPPAVRVALQSYNGQLVVPLPAGEVDRIADGVHRRRNRPTFESSADPTAVRSAAPVDAATDLASSPAQVELPDQALADLLDAVMAYLRTFVVISAPALQALALWVLHTHAIDAAEHTPYLHVTSGTKRAGKTLLLELLEQVVRRPWITQRTTTAALVRKLDKEHPTLLLDELDQALKAGDDYAATLTQTLNAGFKRGGVVSICRGEGAAIQVVDLAVFGPKVLSGIGHLPDTVADRSIVITLRRKTRDEQVARARTRAIRSAAAPLRGPLEQWGIAATSQVKGTEPDVPDALDDRQQDIWAPLLSLADLAGQQWPAARR